MAVVIMLVIVKRMGKAIAAVCKIVKLKTGKKAQTKSIAKAIATVTIGT